MVPMVFEVQVKPITYLLSWTGGLSLNHIHLRTECNWMLVRRKSVIGSILVHPRNNETGSIKACIVTTPPRPNDTTTVKIARSIERKAY